tara:strand:- start:53725 stop:54609 length:885 start_codon:yes stop_codon:yes gene_type:complete
MIKYLTRKQLDIDKYNQCILNSLNTRIYAYSWYLDIVTNESWGALVLNKYEAVMPLPQRSKYFISYIFQPSWIQQLGVFSSVAIDKNSVEHFLNAIPNKFKMVDTFLNSENKLATKKIRTRANYILQLNKPFETLFKAYRKGRKSSVKQGQNYGLKVVGGFNHNEIIQLFKDNKGAELNAKNGNYVILSELMSYAVPRNFVECLSVVSKNNELIAGAFFLKDNKRITYLFSAINQTGREQQAMSFLINHMIERSANSGLIFDFEGSMIPEIASFFKSFGAVKETYYHYNIKRLF